MCIVLVLLRKTPEFTKMGEIHELFVLALSLVRFAGATPDSQLVLTHIPLRFVLFFLCTPNHQLQELIFGLLFDFGPERPK